MFISQTALLSNRLIETTSCEPFPESSQTVVTRVSRSDIPVHGMTSVIGSTISTATVTDVVSTRAHKAIMGVSNSFSATTAVQHTQVVGAFRLEELLTYIDAVQERTIMSLSLVSGPSLVFD